MGKINRKGKSMLKKKIKVIDKIMKSNTKDLDMFMGWNITITQFGARADKYVNGKQKTLTAETVEALKERIREFEKDNSQ